MLYTIPGYVPFYIPHTLPERVEGMGLGTSKALTTAHNRSGAGGSVFLAAATELRSRAEAGK